MPGIISALTAPYIQIRYSVNVNQSLIPTMTTASLPTPYASSATTNTSTSFQAFDNSGATEWSSSATPSGGAPQALSIDLGANVGVPIVQYAIIGSATVALSPKSWTFVGSLTGSVWVTLDTQTNVSAWNANEVRYFTISPLNTTVYRYYGISVTASQGGGNVSITQLSLFPPWLSNSVPGPPLGGYISTTSVGPNAPVEALFNPATIGSTQYACLFVYNSHSTIALNNVLVFPQISTLSNTVVQVGVDPAAVVAVTSTAPMCQIVASQTTAPTGVLFMGNAPVNIGNIGAASCRAVWLSFNIPSLVKEITGGVLALPVVGVPAS